MKNAIQTAASGTANLIATVRSSLQNVRTLLAKGGQSDDARDQIRQLELLEQLLLDQDARLGSFDKVLEEFNYSVAHELCAPLRRICGFTREIMLRSAEQLDLEGIACLDQILDSSQRMSELIDSLMQISRLSHVDMQITSLDLSEIAGEITKELSQGVPERMAVFVIQPRLIVTGDAALLKVALRKLLENAWKFSGHQEPAIIEFGISELDVGTVFYVRDNGIGFDADQKEKLFHPFQRLHDGDGYGGNGMGLTIVRKIIERHRGRIWVEGARDKGATFYFTLPG